ncbi:YjcQ family protein [Peptoniphilus sp. SGI.035]|uniref:YjcQ family protein n=1 Tax=Peptoniphilus sp. SGI.035 TaxID=3420564 RepID=UPI003CFEE1DA
MAKDDYFVIVCYVLKYLYECLKAGVIPKENILNLDVYPVEIKDSYKLNIYKNLLKDGYIDGVEIVDIPRLGSSENLVYIRNLNKAVISPKGIEYLDENSMIKKAIKTLEIISNVLPW